MYHRTGFDSLFDDVRNFFLPERGPAASPQARWIPALDACDRFVLRAFLAGVAPKTVELTAPGNELAIKGGARTGGSEGSKALRLPRGRLRSFERTLELPERTDSSKAGASKTGVLKVRLPTAGPPEEDRDQRFPSSLPEHLASLLQNLFAGDRLVRAHQQDAMIEVFDRRSCSRQTRTLSVS